jgi:GntR family carbon starvation induced transcriptional regulator
MVRMQSKLSGRPLASNAEWEALHVQFHLRLVGASTSKWLQHFIRALIEHSSRYRQVGSHIIAGTPPKRDVAAEHQAILDAALARDADSLVLC